jgi:tetratricopeptide (TPR) repeat protein
MGIGTTRRASAFSSSAPLHSHDEAANASDEALPTPAQPARLERRREIAREVDSLHIALEAPQRTVAGRPTPVERARAGDVQGAIDSLLEVYVNEGLPLLDRALAASTIADIAYEHDATNARAELFFVRARQLFPQLDVRRLHLKLLRSQGRTNEALEVVQSLLRDAPNNLDLRASEVRLLGDTADRAALLSRALALVDLARERGSALTEFQLLLANAYFENKQPEQAIAVFRTVLATSTDRSYLLSAHFGIAEILPSPAFSGGATERAANRTGPHAERINALFEAANVAFREDRFADVRLLAEQILALDPNDGLAHHMWGDATNAETYAARPLIPQLDTQEERETLITQLASRCAEATVQGRPGRVEDLFPEWGELNETQRAHVALSVLGFGALIPQVMEAGAEYHFAGVGTSGAYFDPHIAPRDTNAFSRTYYTIRGWYHGDFIVTGIERLNAGMHSGSSTVSHEFAHLIHGTFARANAVLAAERTPLQQTHAALFLRIHALYEAAQRGESRFYDAYSSNTPFEFFAQAMQALMNPNGGNARRLFSADPALFRLAAGVITDLQTYPRGLALGTHPEIGQESTPSPLNLQGLIDDPDTTPALRQLAESTLAQLEVVFAMRPLAAAAPVLSPSPTMAYARGADLVRRISAGDFDGAVTVTQDIEIALTHGYLSRDELLEATTALAYAACAAASRAHWDFWDYFWSVLSLGIAALYKYFDRAEAREIRDRATALARTPRPPRVSRLEHPDLFSADAVDVANRERQLMQTARILLAGGNDVAAGLDDASIAIMGFSELRAVVALDSHSASPEIVTLSRELATVTRRHRAREITTAEAAEALERLRGSYLALRRASPPTP